MMLTMVEQHQKSEAKVQLRSKGLLIRDGKSEAEVDSGGRRRVESRRPEARCREVEEHPQRSRVRRFSC